MHTSSSLQELLARSEAERTLGPYRLVKRLGDGAFGSVWQAEEVFEDQVLRSVAVKLFSVDDMGPSRGGTDASGGTEGRRNRIFREAQALCKIDHHNVVRYYALAHDSSRSVLGLVMELVTGESLQQKIEDDGKLSWQTVSSIGLAIASALTALHRINIIHRDVKPANIVESGGSYKLIDLGIAGERRTANKGSRVVMNDLPMGAVGTTLTLQTQEMRVEGAPLAIESVLPSGTIGYIDPAAYVEPHTPASDLYSLGAALFECVTGKLPAVAAAAKKGDKGLRGAVLDGRERPPAVHDLEPEVPDRIANVIDALLDPDPSKRPASAEAVVQMLRPERRAGSRVPPEPGSRGRRNAALGVGVLLLASLAFGWARHAQGLSARDWLYWDREDGSGWARRCAAHVEAKRYDSAQGACARSLALGVKDRRVRAETLVALSTVAHHRGRPNQALGFLAQSLATGETEGAIAALKEFCPSGGAERTPGYLGMKIIVAGADAAAGPAQMWLKRPPGPGKNVAPVLLDAPECVALISPSRPDPASLRVYYRVHRNHAKAGGAPGYVLPDSFLPRAARGEWLEKCYEAFVGGRRGDATEMCRKAIEAGDADQVMRAARVLGKVRAQLSDLDNALEWLTLVWQFNPDPTSDVRDEIGRLCAAKSALRRAPDDPRNWLVVSWPFDDRTANLRPEPSTTALGVPETLVRPTCVLGRKHSSPYWFEVDGTLDGRNLHGFIHGAVIDPLTEAEREGKLQ